MAYAKIGFVLGTAAALAACSGKAPDNQIPLTNTDNVVLNDAQANFQMRNDEPPPALNQIDSGPPVNAAQATQMQTDNMAAGNRM